MYRSVGNYILAEKEGRTKSNMIETPNVSPLSSGAQ